MRRLLPLLVLLLPLAACFPPPAKERAAPLAAQPASQAALQTEEPDDVTPEPVDEPPMGTGAALPAIGERLLPGGLLELGDPDAKIALLLFTNHSCAYCQKFQRDILPRLIADHVRPGTLRVTLVPFRLEKYPESAKAASLLVCAAGQGKGIIMNELLFAREGRNLDALLADKAVTGQMDSAKLRDCMGQPSTELLLGQQRAWARGLGVSLIPTTLVNGQRITGLPEYAELRAAIGRAMEEGE